MDKLVAKLPNGKGNPQYLKEVKKISKEIRDNILKYIMIRRTRTDIKNYFDKDIKEQHLVFPEVSSPKSIIYEFDKKQINYLLKQFR